MKQNTTKKISGRKSWRIVLSDLKRWMKKNRTALIVFAIYMTISLVAVLFHENWEDEAQAWLTARDCSPFELVGRMSVEGHFMPWYLILMPFAKLEFPYKTMNIISWLITGSAAWLMLKHLPCKFYKRVIFIFMLPMIYLYPAISRCYCLLPLGTILAIMFYKDRFKRPLRYLFSILIIANVHTYTFMFAFVMGIEYLVDWIKIRKRLSKKQNSRIMYGITAVALMAGLTYFPLVGSVSISGQSASGLKLLSYQNPIKELFVYTPIAFFQWFSGPLPSLAYITASFLIVWEFFTRKKEFFKIAIATIWQWMICCFVFEMILPQRVMIISFIILFFVSCRGLRVGEDDIFSKSAWGVLNIIVNLLFVTFTIWLEVDTGNINLAFLTLFSIAIFILAFFAQNKKTIVRKKIRKIGKNIAKVALLFLALLNVWMGLTQVKDEVDSSYSDALATAEFINNNLDNDSILLNMQESSMFLTAIVPYLKVKDDRFYSMRRETFYTFTLHLTPTEPQLGLRDITWNKYCRLGKKLYYIGISKQYYETDIFNPENSFAPTDDLENNGILKEIFDIYEGNAPTEHYTIYKVNPNVCDKQAAY